MSTKDQSLIAGMMESFVSEVPANPFVSFCVSCNKGVIKEEMVYEKGRVFHKDCFTKNGASFPAVNQELLNESTNAKVQLIQLKNLKARMVDDSSINRAKPKRKTKKKDKRKTKRRPKRRIAKRKRTATKRKKTKKKSRKRILKKRQAVRRRSSTKRKKTHRKIQRKSPRKAKKKTRKRR